jgi:hypothetical protein
MHGSERGSVRRSVRVAVALVALPALIVAGVTAAHAEQTATRASKLVGQVTRTKGDVTVGRGIPVAKKRNLRAGDFVATGANGEAKLSLERKRWKCAVFSNTQLRVVPSENVPLQIINGNKADLACATSPRFRQLESVKGPKGHFKALIRDPVFSISVRRNRALVKVSRGSLVLIGRSGLRGGVVIARKQQSVVPPGGDPLGVRPYHPTTQERAAFSRLESTLPAVHDTTPPTTTVLAAPPSPTAQTSATFVFRANEAGASFSCSLDGATFRFCRSPATFVGLDSGRHRLSVRATDLEGNTGKPVTRTWTVKGAGRVRFRQIIARNATDVRLDVDAEGRALVTYRSGGSIRRVLAWGAVNALPPTQGRDQVNFVLRYGADPVRNVCGPYSGPPLAWLVVACTAPDGTNWALQSFQQGLRNYGVDPTPYQAAWQLWLSHWSGPLAQLEVRTDWAYRRFDHLYGRLTYLGRPVHGFQSTSSGRPLDSFGRNIYVDTFDSIYGSGWKRENSFLSHRPTGAFCYGFFPHGAHPPGVGTRYRATAIGPGVTPLVSWEGPAPGPFDAARDQTANLEQKQLFAGDKLCAVS